jgi:hypothetical protein
MRMTGNSNARISPSLLLQHRSCGGAPPKRENSMLTNDVLLAENHGALTLLSNPHLEKPK